MTDEEVLDPTEVLVRYLAGTRDFRGTVIDGQRSASSFKGTSLEGADFTDAFIIADFTECRLSGACFRSARLKGCTFSGADLTDVDFSGADMDDTVFHGAVLAGANFAGATDHDRTFEAGEVPPS